MAKVKIEPQELIKEYALELRKKINISKIILFGSAARGEMKEESDLDLIVISRTFKKMGFLKRLQFLSHSRRGLSRRVAMDILGYTPAEAKKLALTSSMLRESMRQGKVIWP